MKNIKFDMEAKIQDCAFFALYAGLRMYKEQKDRQPKEAGTFSIAAAEAYCLLQDLKESHPKEYAEAVAEYDEVYGATPAPTSQGDEAVAVWNEVFAEYDEYRQSDIKYTTNEAFYNYLQQHFTITKKR